MGYRCSFMDNEVYSAQDVNERFACMFTEGVSLADGENLLADLNQITSEVATAGVIQDSCKVVKTDTGYKILKGSAIMPDGSGITFDDQGYEFTAEYGVYQYVYLRRNEPYNRIDVVVSTEAPDENCVSLAHITATGLVSDHRKYAQTKLISTQESTLRKVTKEFLSSNSYVCETIDFGSGAFTYFAILDGKIKTATPRKLSACKENLVEITDGEELEIALMGATGVTTAILHIKKDGQYLEVWFESNDRWMDYELTFGVI
ncbi:MAG: hypothetical protein E7417_01945 [Ruminococcaceae bacterium]|nr:hypothetical protein [Oscillospiraceae bacterium]